MPQAAVKEKPTEDDIPVGAELVSLVNATPSMVLLKPEIFRPFMIEVRRKVAAEPLDISTVTGRDARKSLAFQVTKTKTAVEAAKLALTEEMRVKVKTMNAVASDICGELAEFAIEVRKPVTDWEAQEKDRIDRLRREIGYIEDLGRGMIGGASRPPSQLLAELTRIVVDASFGEFEDAATAAKETALEKVALLQRQEDDRIELDRLRAEKAERDKAEAERVAKEQAEHRAKAEAEAAEARRIAAEQAEKDRIATAERRAEDAAKAAAEKQAQAQREAMERAHAAALKAEQDKAAAAEAWRREKEEQIARQKAAEEALAKRVATEEAARAADMAHRSEVMGAAKAAIMEHGGVNEKAAKAIVLAIVAGSIPHVTLKF